MNNRQVTSTLKSILFCCITQISASAQTAETGGIIKGKLFGGNTPLTTGIQVGLYKAKDTTLIRKTLTNDTQEYIFNKLPDGAYLIGTGGLGYKKVFSGPYVLDAAHQTIIAAEHLVIPEAQELRQVDIQAKVPLVERRGDKVILNVAASALSAGNTAIDILSRAPGVSIDNTGRISLKGKAGVTILINNKPTYLSPEQVTNLLRATAASTIQSIEILANPSAKYDAAGSGGIINIKLKKSSGSGTNATLTAAGGYGTYYKSNGGINFNHQAKQLNIFGDYNYTNNKEYEDLSVQRSTAAGTEETFFNQQAKQAYLRRNHSYKAGVDYNLNENHVLGFLVSGYQNNVDVTDHIRTLIGSQALKTDSIILAENPGTNRYQNQTYNLNYKGVLDTMGQEFNADLDFSRVRNLEQVSYNNTFYDNGGMPYKPAYSFRNTMPSKIDIWAGQLNYTYPFNSKMKLETGVKASQVNTDNDFQSANLINGNWMNDASARNRFTYKEQVSAAFASLHKDFASTTLQVGLRTELTHSEGNSVTLQQVTKRSYLNLFPNLSIQQVLSKDHELGFSYSRRIDRPDYQSLNPFVYYADLYTLSQGNPLLKPQYSNAFELSYGYKKKTNVSLSYTNTSDVITTTLLADTIQKTLLMSEQNLASRRTVSMNVSRPVDLTSWWSTSNDLSLYYSRFSSPNLMGMPFSNGKLTLMINTVQSFQINKSVSAELSANYTSSQAYGTYVARPMYGVDLGLSKEFASKRASIKLSATDVFNQRKIQIQSAVVNQDYQLSQKQESRIFRLSLSYKLGSSSAKVPRARGNSSATEQGRVKSGN
jgi:outer membrane receptor protein involved in Fe transport